MKKSAILLLSYLIAFGVYGQPAPPSLNEAEIRLQSLFYVVSAKNPDEQKRKINDSIATLLEKTLNIKGSFEYPFDSLKYVGKITSADKKIRIFTWNITLKDATNQYFGFLMHRSNNNYRITRLCDSSATMKDPTLAALDTSHWYGCLIYDIIEKKLEGETYYTLLGYDPDNLFLTRKIVDVLWFNDDQPVFGKPFFQYKKAMQFRLIFEYSAKVQMMLTWNKTMNMILFDHLVPISSSYSGNFRYYAPDMSYDGLSFEKGIWVVQENVDVRN
jgi:hypothetical protein